LTPGSLAVDQAITSVTIEPQHPIIHRLPANASDPRCLAPAANLINYRRRQRPANMPGIATRLRKPQQIHRRDVRPNPAAVAIATSLKRECRIPSPRS